MSLEDELKEELIFTIAFAGTILAAVLINLGLIYIAKIQIRFFGSSSKIIKSTLGGLKDPWKKDNESLEELSNLVTAIKETEEAKSETKDL